MGVLAWDGADHLGFGLALTPEQRGPKRRGRKKNKCPSSRGWRSRHKPHLHPPDEATGVWRTGTTSGAVARRFSARPARVSDLRGCLRLAGVPGFGSDEETPIACLQHQTPHHPSSLHHQQPLASNVQCPTRASRTPVRNSEAWLANVDTHKGSRYGLTRVATSLSGAATGSRVGSFTTW